MVRVRVRLLLGGTGARYECGAHRVGIELLHGVVGLVGVRVRVRVRG